jgi:hypothetical protein
METDSTIDIISLLIVTMTYVLSVPDYEVKTSFSNDEMVSRDVISLDAKHENEMNQDV